MSATLTQSMAWDGMTQEQKRAAAYRGPAAPEKELMEISLRGSGWVVKSNDPKWVELFGTDTLPLPFTEVASEATVLAAVQYRNPSAVVTVRRRGQP